MPYFVRKDDTESFTVVLRTKEDFEFDVDVTNQPGLTYISGRAWKEVAIIYNIQVGQKMYFTVNTKDPWNRVTTGNLPVTHPSSVPT